MTKAKVAARRPVVAEPDETELPEAWRRRPWLPILIVFGAGLALIRARSNSVYPGMIVHAMFNAIALIVSVTT